MFRNLAFLGLTVLAVGMTVSAEAKPKTHNAVSHLCGEFEVGTNSWNLPSVDMWKTNDDGPHFDVDQSVADAFTALRTPDNTMTMHGFEIWGHPDCACVSYLTPPPVKMAFPPNTYYNVQTLIGLPSACPKQLPVRRL